MKSLRDEILLRRVMPVGRWACSRRKKPQRRAWRPRHAVKSLHQGGRWHEVTEGERNKIQLYFLRARSYIASQLYLPTASDIAHYVRSCVYIFNRNSPKVNITSAGHITHEVNITVALPQYHLSCVARQIKATYMVAFVFALRGLILRFGRFP